MSDPVAGGMMTVPVNEQITTLPGILDKGIGMIGDSEFEGIYAEYMVEGQL